MTKISVFEPGPIAATGRETPEELASMLSRPVDPRTFTEDVAALIRQRDAARDAKLLRELAEEQEADVRRIQRMIEAAPLSTVNDERRVEIDYLNSLAFDLRRRATQVERTET